MGKKWIIIATIIIGVILAIICGIYAYHNGGISETNMISDKELASVEERQNTKEENNEYVVTSANNATISPNAIIVQKKYYKGCDHLIRDVIDIPENLINQTEEKVKSEYLGWKLESYDPKEIVMYKEFNGFCNEHYMVREHNGYISIYYIDEQGVETLKEDTEISTNYLPEKDLEDLQIGIQIVGERNLYNFLENYE